MKDQRQGADSPYVATIDPSAAQDHRPSRHNAIPTVAALQEATETPIAQSAPATTCNTESDCQWQPWCRMKGECQRQHSSNNFSKNGCSE